LHGPRRADCEFAAQRPYPPIPSAKKVTGAYCALCMVVEQAVVATSHLLGYAGANSRRCGAPSSASSQSPENTVIRLRISVTESSQYQYITHISSTMYISPIAIQTTRRKFSRGSRRNLLSFSTDRGADAHDDGGRGRERAFQLLVGGVARCRGVLLVPLRVALPAIDPAHERGGQG